MDQPHVFNAPWSNTLKFITGLSMGIFIACVLIGLLTGPRGAMVWTLSMIAIPGIFMVIMPFFAITGFSLSPGTLHINRPGRQTNVPLENLKSAEFVPDAMKHSIRILGNGGLFAFTGKYRNKKLGNYTAFVTDPGRCIVLTYYLPIKQQEKKIVVSPGDTQRFLSEIKNRIRK